MNQKTYYSDEKGRHEAKEKDLEYILSWQSQAQEAQRLIEAAEKEKIQKRESAVSKLKAIGLTDDEIAALIP
jgi:DNA-binding NarL/FixJ family response regulator